MAIPDPTKPGKRPTTLAEAIVKFPRQNVTVGLKAGSFILSNKKTGATARVNSWVDPSIKIKSSKEALGDQLNS